MEHRVKHILRLSLADYAFRESSELVTHLLELGIKEQSILYSSMCSGIAVCYSRPFMSAEGLGRIGKEFEDFSDSESPKRFKSIHEILLKARNQMAAHKDLKQGGAEYKNSDLEHHPGHIDLEIAEKSMTTTLTAIFIRRKVLEESVDLFEFQRAKLKKLLTKARKSLYPTLGDRKAFSYIFE